MPTTSVLLRISPFSRSLGLLDQIGRHGARGNAVKGEDFIAGGVEVRVD